MYKFFIIAGELSGDIHGGKLIQSIKGQYKNASFLGHGGDNMASEGMKIIEHINNLSIMGFFEVMRYLPKMNSILNKTATLIKDTNPDRVILIDFPGFNLRLAKKIKPYGIPITYFILPQAWAWKENRLKTMKNCCDQLISIFPFEYKWYKERELQVEYFGHPFVDLKPLNFSSKDFLIENNLVLNEPILLLLPGSRQQEIDKHLPIFTNTVSIIKNDIPSIQIIIVKAAHVNLPSLPSDYRIVSNLRKAMAVGTAAIVASGTATLECAMQKIPMVVCYKLSFLSWMIAKMLIKVNFSSIVNLIAKKTIVPELLQHRMHPTIIANKISPFLNKNSNKRNIMLNDLNILSKNLGLPGVYNRIAESIISKSKKNHQ